MGGGREGDDKHNMTGEQLDESLVALALVGVVVGVVVAVALLLHFVTAS